MQHVVARVAVNNTLKIAYTQSLALAVSKARIYEEMNKFIDSKCWERMSSVSTSLSSKRYKEIEPNSPESYVSVLVNKFFDDQIRIVEGLIENAILKATYKPLEETAGKRINDLLPLFDITIENDVEVLPEGETVQWSEDRLRESAEDIVKMKQFLINMVRRQFFFNEYDAEDILQEAAIRFLSLVQKGRLPEKSSDKQILRRIMARFATYAAIDEIRKVKGRNGQKPLYFQSMQKMIMVGQLKTY